MKKGKYIIFEGGEGCGKSTQTKLLYEYLTKKGVACVQSREPGGVESSEKIRELLLHSRYDLDSRTELFLFEAARTEYFKNFVIPKINYGITVLTTGLATQLKPTKVMLEE